MDFCRDSKDGIGVNEIFGGAMPDMFFVMDAECTVRFSAGCVYGRQFLLYNGKILLVPFAEYQQRGIAINHQRRNDRHRLNQLALYGIRTFKKYTLFKQKVFSKHGHAEYSFESGGILGLSDQRLILYVI